MSNKLHTAIHIMGNSQYVEMCEVSGGHTSVSEYAFVSVQTKKNVHHKRFDSRRAGVEIINCKIFLSS